MRRSFTIAALVLALALAACPQAPRTPAASRHSAAELARKAGYALFVDSDLAEARRAAASAVDADPANLEALFITMEAAAHQADTSAELDAAVRLCELQTRDPRADIAAARILDLAANTPAFRSVSARIRKLAKTESAQADFLRLALLAAVQDGLPGPAALELAHYSGILTDWRIAGPFGRLPSVDFERAWAPEGQPGASSSGAADQFADGNVTLPESSSRPGVYYAITEAAVASGGEWLLRAESAGTLTIYVDGKPALTHDARFRSLPAIASAPMNLAAGTHRVLVKFLPSASPFRIALVRPRYRTESTVVAGSRQEQAYLKAAQRYWTADYAGAIAIVSADSRPSAALAFLESQAWAHLASGTAEEVSALNATLAAAPDAYAAETALAARYDSDDRVDDALPRVLHVLAARSDFAPAQELKYRLAARMHWNAEASDAMTALVRVHPSCSLLRDAASFFRSTAQYQRAADAEDRLRGCGDGNLARAAERVVDSARARAIDPGDAFYTRFRRDGPQLVRETASRLFSGGPAVTLLDTRVLRFRTDGGADLYVHKLTRVLDRDGIERYGEVAIPAGADLIELRTLTPAGVVAAEPELDNRKATLSMPALVAGNVVELEYVLHYAAGAVELETGITYEFGSFDAPILFAQFAVISPFGERMHVAAAGAPVSTVTRAGNDEIRVWDRNDIAQSVQEPDMPRSGQLPAVVVSRSSAANWSDVRAYDRAAIIDAAHAGERVQQLAATIPAGTDTDKAHAVYRVLTSKVRASGQSIQQGLTPAEDTLSAGDGSRTAALLAVTRVLGIPAELVLAREIGAPPPRQASLEAYTHPLVRLRLRVAGTDQHAIVDVEHDGLPFGSLPPNLDRTRALLVPVKHASASDPMFIVLPAATDAEQSVADGSIVFDSDGNLSATLRITLGTWRASQIRSILRGIPPGGRQRFFEQLATRIFPGAVEVAGEAVDENDSERPLQLNVRCRAQHFVSFSTGSTDVDQLVPALGLRKMYVRSSERRFPLYIDNPFFETTRFRVRLPDNVRVSQLAPDFTANGRFGAYAVKFRQTSAHEFEVARSFRVPVQVIAPADYPDFVRFATSIDDAERQRLTVERADLSATKR